MKKHRLMRAAVAAIAMAAGCMALSGPAAAAPDMLTFAGCLSNNTSDGCVPVSLTSAPLQGPAGVATSPDGKSVYVASATGNSIAQFVRANPGGQLTYDGCLANNTAQNCTALPTAAFDVPRAVTISADGSSVYVISGGRQDNNFVGSITHFTRNQTTGRLAFNGCWAGNGAHGCTNIPFEPVHDPTAVAVSPDGKSVYVAARQSFVIGTISQFFRNPTTGSLTFGSCLADVATTNCPDNVAFQPLFNVTGIAVTSRSVYVTATGFHTLSHFARNTLTGQLIYVSCQSIQKTQGCADLDGEPIRGPRAVAVSPDGTSVYVASSGGSRSVAHFHRHSPNGNLSYIRCHADTGTQGCIDLPNEPFGVNGPNALVVSPDGKSVYATGPASVTQLDRDGGLLFFKGCLGLKVDPTDDCPILPGMPIRNASGVAVSPDSKSVYVSATDGNSVAHFVR